MKHKQIKMHNRHKQTELAKRITKDKKNRKKSKRTNLLTSKGERKYKTEPGKSALVMLPHQYLQSEESPQGRPTQQLLRYVSMVYG